MRRKAREVAFKVLFQVDVGGADPGEALAREGAEAKLPPASTEFAGLLVRGVLGTLDELDSLIGRHAREWTPGRMSAVDRNLLRLATFEIAHCSDVPLAVAINESLELAKIFSSDEAARFINGILGQLAETLRPSPPGEDS
jgi:N utilization substance protein B